MGPAEPGETSGDYSVIDMISHGQECGCYSFVILFLALLGLRCCVGFSLVGVSKGHALFVMWLLNVVASLVVEHGWALEHVGFSSFCTWAP